MGVKVFCLKIIDRVVIVMTLLILEFTLIKHTYNIDRCRHLLTIIDYYEVIDNVQFESIYSRRRRHPCMPKTEEHSGE